MSLQRLKSAKRMDRDKGLKRGKGKLEGSRVGWRRRGLTIDGLKPGQGRYLVLPHWVKLNHALIKEVIREEMIGNIHS